MGVGFLIFGLIILGITYAMKLPAQRFAEDYIFLVLGIIFCAAGVAIIFLF